ncbi:MAG: hypothetical protein A2Z18_04860 [Armatimonadetes bacterium RBG_16_58_9]|nr:MAG: hypothetical protein A2Z18_04860 [Armatimonadetes bacterium RBG_16_58_9]
MSGIEDKLSSYLDSRGDYATDLLCKLISYRSVAGREQEVQDFLLDQVRRLGYEAVVAPVDEDIAEDPDYTLVPGHESYAGRNNILVNILGSGGGRSVIVNSHSDVVTAPDEMFVPRHVDGVVHGRGACDAKGQVVAILLVLSALGKLGLKLKGGVQAQLVIEEESGGNGALSVIRQGAKADAAVVLEPTSLEVRPANRGAVWFKLAVTGRSVHMGRYWDGVSAVDEMIGLIGVLKEYETFLRNESEGDPLFPFEPNPVTVNIGQIQGGDWPATVPQQCRIEGGIAFLPNRRIEQIRDELRSLIDRGSGDWAREHYSLEFSRLRNEAFETGVDHPAVASFCRAAESVLGPRRPLGWTASCDARLFYHRGGMPTMVFGAGDLGHAHSLNEQIRIADILRAAEVLIRFITDWCGVEQ